MQEFVRAFEGTRPMIRSGDESDGDSITPPDHPRQALQVTQQSRTVQEIQTRQETQVRQEPQATQEAQSSLEPPVRQIPQPRRSQRQASRRAE
jgi:hypothetical protein